MSRRGSKSDHDRQRPSILRWENEGGAEPEGPQTHLTPDQDEAPVRDQYDLKVTRVEFADLHARLIALESVTISLLYTASDRQLELAREMADYISPREGFTPHPLSLNAALHINQLVDRTLRLRDKRVLANERL